MAEYIEKKAAINAIRKAENHAFNSFYKGLVKAHKIVADLPSADVVPVVRCRECAGCEYDTALDQYWCTRGRLIIGRHVMPDDFCSYGERREA